MPRESGYGPRVAELTTADRSGIASRWAPRPRDPAPEPTVEELRKAVGWSGDNAEFPPGPHGCEWQCHDCGRTLTSPSGARKHEDTKRHVVLRTDWMADDYWPFVVAQRNGRAK